MLDRQDPKGAFFFLSLVTCLVAALPLLLLQSCAARRAAPKSPMTGVTMQAHLVPNYNLRSLIREWQERR
jgi:hypothetical protein